ncbi:MAG: UvrD-helicase domain-containing protein [Geodermatophilaceae bacterium]
MLADIFSFTVNTERTMEELLAEKFPYFLPLIEQIKDVHARYERKKKATNSMDFDDLLEKTLRMLKEHEEVADFYRRKFQFILVDEYQDTNKIQADFIDTLAARASQRHGGGRRRAIDLLVARREFQKHPRFPGALSGRAGIQDRAELPQRAGDPLRSRTRRSRRTCEQFKKELSATRETKELKPALVRA